MGMEKKTLATLLVTVVFSLSVICTESYAESTPKYSVTVNPTTPDSPMYTPLGRNWTMSFEALWSFGINFGQSIKEATITVQVNNSKNQVVNTLLLSSTVGIFSFNYSSSTADVLTFTPIKLTTEDGTEWKHGLIDAEKNLYGLQSKSAVVWWDTFQVSLVSQETETLGSTLVSVNVTYLLLPEDGLTLPEWATYSHETYLPKAVHDATVSINGLKAEETSTGVFTASVPTWLPTSYVHVVVSQEGWINSYEGFSFTHDGNMPLWLYAVAIALTLAVGSMFFYVYHLKRKEADLSNKKYYAVFGGFLLAITSFISLYLGLVGLDSTLHGFDWFLLTAMGFVSFGFGLAASIFSVARKNQALVIFAILVPFVTNSIISKSSFEAYEIANPLVILAASTILSIASGVLICNADEVFT